MTEEDTNITYLRLDKVNKRNNRQYILIAFVLLIFTILATFIYLSLAWYKGMVLRNPMFDYIERQQVISKNSQQMVKDYTRRKTEFNSAATLTAIMGQKDPQQEFVRYLIDRERDYQDFILYTIKAVNDLSRLVGGVDEWFYYESAKLKKVVSSSRNRQKSLRGLLKKQKREKKSRKK